MNWVKDFTGGFMSEPNYRVNELQQSSAVAAGGIFNRAVLVKVVLKNKILRSTSPQDFLVVIINLLIH